MAILRPTFLMVLLACVAGCAMRVPFDKLRYVGDWQGETAHLLITPQGYVRYEQWVVKGEFLQSEFRTGMDGPLKAFDGDNFTVGIGPVSSHFIVDKPPYLDGDQWKMVVRKHELVRIDP